MPLDDANRHIVLNNLDPCHGMKLERSNGTGNMDRAIYYSEQAVGSLDSDRFSKVPLLANLGNLILQRYERTNSSADLDPAVELTNLAQKKMGPGDLNKPQAAVDMVKTLGKRFNRDSNTEDLNRAARLAEIVVDSTPTDYPGHYSWLIQSARLLTL